MKTFPLLQSQIGVILENMTNLQMTKYNLPVMVIMDGDADVEHLMEALHKILEKRRVFKTRFIQDEEGNIRQYSDEDMDFPIQRKKMTEEEVKHYSEHEFVRPFDLFGKEPLGRIEIIESDRHVYLLLDFHHAIIDGMSYFMLLNYDLQAAFNGKEIIDNPYGMYEHAADEEASFDSEAYREAAAYFKERFAGIEFTDIADNTASPWGVDIQHSAYLPAEMVDPWCQKKGFSANQLFAAAFGIVLSKFSREEQVAYYTIFHGRIDQRLKGAMGMFVKSEPVLAEVNSTLSVTDYISSVGRELKKTGNYGIYPFSHFCRDLGMTPSASYGYQGNVVQEYVELGGRRYPAIQLSRGLSDEDLTCVIYINNGKYEIRLNASEKLFSDTRLQAFADAVAACVTNMIQQRPEKVSDVKIILPEKEKEILSMSQGERFTYDEKDTFVSLFMKQADVSPEAVAVVDEEGSYTYAQLDNLSSALASDLTELRLISRSDPFVGIMLGCEKSFSVAAIAVEKAGGAYVPLDYEYPDDRLHYMLKDSQARVLITSHEVMAQKSRGGYAFTAENVLYIDDFLAAAGDVKAGRINKADPDLPAYMIYTSGSTGKPKGVVIPNRAKANFVHFIAKEWRLSESSRICCHSSFSFDASVEDLYPVLTVGGRLYIVPEKARKDLKLLSDFINSNKITGGCYTTQLGQMLLQSYQLPTLEYLVVGGEKMTTVPPCDCRLINTYGPTEVTVDSTFYQIDKNREYKNIPIGRPLYNMAAYVVDPNGHLLPAGVPGELCMSGVQLSDGYWNRPELTKEKFVDAEFCDEKIYHTGDLVYYNDENQIEYLGRIDSQVKLRGFRIEIGEIESHISSYEGILMVSVQVKEVSGVQHLCAYYTAEGKIDQEALKQYLAGELTEYMVPTVYMQMDEMPLMPSGKINARALPSPVIEVQELVSPETEKEKELFNITAGLLENDHFGVTTNLIMMGMTSLLAMRLSALIAKQTAYTVPVKDILNGPTIRDMALAAQVSGEEEMTARQKRDTYPLTENQRGVYIDWDMNRDAVQYNIPGLIKFSDIDVDRLETALKETVDAHPILKARLKEDTDDVVMLRRDDAPAVVNVTVLDREPDEDFFRNLVKPFDLFNENLYRIHLFRTPEAVYIFRDIHHIVFDGASDMAFMRDLMQAYEGNRPQAETWSYFEHALIEKDSIRSEKFDRAEEYFKGLLSGVESISYPYSDITEGPAWQNATVKVEGEQIRQFCKSNGITESNYFLTVLMQLLHRTTRQECIAITTIDNGRGDWRFSDSVGMFVKTLPVVSNLTAGPVTMAEAAGVAQEQFINTIGNSIYPFTNMVERFGLRPNIMYAYQGGISDMVNLGDAAILPLELDTAKTPLQIEVEPAGEDYTIYAEFDGSLYHVEDISHLISAMANLAVTSLESEDIHKAALIDDTDEDELLKLGKGESLFYDTDLTLVSLFERSAAKYGNLSAVVFNGREFTYAQLDAISTRLAAFLHNKYGIGAQDAVGVMITRSERMFILPMAIMKTGAAYMPLDYHFPEDRLTFMCEDARVDLIISEGNLLEQAMPGWTGQVLKAETLGEDYQGNYDRMYSGREFKKAEISPEDRCVILYTSGSTGKPKGVELLHKGVVNFSHWYVKEYDITSADRVVGYANFGFDAHLIDLYPTFLAGAQVHILSDEVRLDLLAMYDYLQKHRLTAAFLTTQVGRQFATELTDHSLRVLSIGGEALKPMDTPSFRFYNVYGPTECSLFSTYYPVHGRFEKNYIGRPLDNYMLYVMDVNMNMVPWGAAGELVIAGPGVAKGYLNRPELNAEKFISIRGERAYRSGDLVRWSREGYIEFIGRIDNQVKLRGLRIELGEIEARAETYPGIRTCTAAVKEVFGAEQLCCYFESDEEVDVDKLKEYLSENLTDFMVPTSYMRMEALPLNPNGKVDRKALPLPKMKLDELVAPETAREIQITKIVEELLGTDQFGVTTNLVSVGLTSLQAMRLAIRIRQQLGLTIQTKDIMSSPHIRAMAQVMGEEDRDSEKKPEYAKREFYPMTENQRGVYIDWEQNRDALQYNIPTAFHLKDINAFKLADAAEKVIGAHAYLNTHLGYSGEDVVLVRCDEMRSQVEIHTVTEPVTEEFLQSRVRPFDLFEDCLWRVELYKYNNDTWFFMDIHHLVFDGLSTSIFLKELFEAYQGDQIASETYTAYDRALDEANILNSSRYKEAESYFDALCESVSAVDYPHSFKTGENGGNDQLFMEAAVNKEETDALCSRLNITANSFFLTVLLQILHRTTREEGLMVTTISNGRDDVRMASTVGMFVKTLPVVSKWERDASFEDTASSIHEQMLQTLSRDFYPFTHFTQRHHVRPQIMFAYQGGVLEDGLAEGIDIENITLDIDTSKVFLTVTVMPDQTGKYYSILLDYDKACYSSADMKKLTEAISTLSLAAARDSASPVKSLPIISEEENLYLDTIGRGEKLVYDYQETVPDIFIRRTRETPHAPAVVFRDRILSYEELNDITDCLALRLKEMGVGKDKAVGVMIDRSELMAIYPMAVMKAGGAYMPLDPHFPEERLSFMCEDAGVEIILSEGTLVRDTMPSFKGQVFDSGELRRLPAAGDTVNESGPDDAAVILFTSGSTGKPKGVVLEHHGIVNFCYWYVKEMEMTEKDHSAAYANFGFDAHMIDIYPTYLAGGTAYVIPSEMRMDLTAMNTYFEENAITVAFLTTQIGCQMATLFDNKSLRCMSTGGEKLPPVEKPAYKFYNVYGPTECSMFSTFYPVTEKYYDGQTSIIGRPLDNYELYVVDDNLMKVPFGVPGELVIAGIGVGREYLNRPDISREKFVRIDGKNAYRSGDLVRWMQNSDIEFLGRIDKQVKLRGLRIELGEIEAAVTNFKGIRQAVVDVKEINSVQHLCCYYVADEEIDENLLKDYLGESLTEFMIPDSYMPIDSLPLNPNGKVDRAALPIPQIRNTQQYIAPETKPEMIIADMFRNVLGIEDKVGALDSFFALGGDSIKAIRLASLLRQKGIVLQVADIMKFKTVRALAGAVGSFTDTIRINQEEWSGEVANSAIVQYFFDLNLPVPKHFNQTTMLRAAKRVDPDALKESLAELTRHHDMLRAVVKKKKLYVKAFSKNEEYYSLEEYYPSSVDEMRTIADKLNQTIDLENGPMMKCGLFHLKDYDALLMVIHHLVVDGVSWRILVEDLCTAYRQIEEGKKVSLPEKTNSYREYVEALKRYKKSYKLKSEKLYWKRIRKKCQHLPLSEGLDYTRRFGIRVDFLSAFVTDGLLHRSSEAFNTEINDLLMTALGRSYFRLTGNRAVSIQLEGHGREPIGEPLYIDRTVGWFTSIYPVVLENLGTDSDIRKVKETLRRIPNKGLGYGQLYGMDTEYTSSIGFNYLGDFGEGASDSGLMFEIVSDLPEGMAVAPANVFGPSLSINCLISDGQLVVYTSFDKDSYSEEEAESFAGGFISELEELVKLCMNNTERQVTATDLGEYEWSDETFRKVQKHFEDQGVSLKRIYPLTPMQEGMLLKAMTDPDSSAYRITTQLEINMLPTREQLEEVAAKMVQAHEVLTTSIIYKDVKIYRQAITDRPMKIVMLDASGEEDIDGYMERLRIDEVEKRLDLEDDPLMLIICVKISETRAKLLFISHHIIEDGWCLAIIFGDFKRILESVVSGKEIQLTSDEGRYEDYVRRLLLKDKEKSRDYWQGLLEDYETKAAIPSYGQIADEERSDVSELTVSIADEVMARLSGICRENDVTMNSVVELVWGMVLQVNNRCDDALFVKVVSGRNDVELDLNEQVGLFINSVPVRIHTPKTMTVGEALKEVQKQAGETSPHDYFPLSEIQQLTSLGRDLFQSILAFENFPQDEEETDDGLLTLTVDNATEEVFNELSVTAYMDDERLSFRIRFDPNLYRKEEIQTLLDTFETIIAGVAESADRTLNELDLVSEKDKEQLISLGAGDHVDYDINQTVTSAFVEIAEKMPDAVAVADRDGQLTYREMDELSNALAHQLIEEGVSPDDFVAIMLDRFKEFPLAVYAVHKAGAAYVPLDLEYPNERIAFMLENSKAQVLITTHKLLEAKQAESGLDVRDTRIVFMDDFAESQMDKTPINLATPDSLAYMIYTSGSTGLPKGAVLHHAGLMNVACACVDLFSLTPDDRIGGHRSFSFDAHIQDLYPVLTVGGSFHIMPSEIRKDIDAIHDFLIRHGITGGGYTTAIMSLVINTYPDLPVRFITGGGEKMTGVYSDKVAIYNSYGPTECTCDTASYKIAPGSRIENIPIGKTIANNYSFILDDEGRLLPKGAVGELCFAGIQVGRGYWKLPERTKEVFMDQCPFVEKDAWGRKIGMYRTGDLARWNKDGQLEYVGRIDTQVKLRGYRIELGEIENKTQQIEGIKLAAAEVRKIATADHLVLYYSTEDKSRLSGEDIRYALEKSSLPEYMVPDVYMKLEEMPLTPNGKINRKALPEPRMEALSSERVAPENLKEQILFDIISNLIGRDDFGVTDDVMKLGMTSLMAIRMVMEAKKYGFNVKVSDFVRYPDIRRMAKGEHAMCYWLNEYSPDKPVVVLIYGFTPYSTLEKLKDKLCERYSVICIETIMDHFKYIFEDADYQEVIEMYYALLDYKLTSSCKIHAFVGHCFGGETAYRLAVRWAESTGHKAQVLMMDTYWTGVVYDMSEKILEKLPENIKKKYARDIDKGLENNRIGAALSSDDPVPSYDGKVSYFKALQPYPLPFDDDVAQELGDEYVAELKEEMGVNQLDAVGFWKKILPDARFGQVDADHFTMMEEQFVDQYVDVLAD